MTSRRAWVVALVLALALAEGVECRERAPMPVAKSPAQRDLEMETTPETKAAIGGALLGAGVAGVSVLASGGEGSSPRTMMAAAAGAVAGVAGTTVYSHVAKAAEEAERDEARAAAAALASVVSLAPLDDSLYGACLPMFREETSQDQCDGMDGDTVVTEYFADLMAMETKMVARAFKPGLAREAILRGISTGIAQGSTLMRHVVKRTKQQTVFACTDEEAEHLCQQASVDEQNVPASIGTDRRCVSNIVRDPHFGARYGIPRRHAQLLTAFQSADPSLFVGDSRAVGAAVVICVRLALKGNSNEKSDAAIAKLERLVQRGDFVDLTSALIAHYRVDEVAKESHGKANLNDPPFNVPEGPVLMTQRPNDGPADCTWSHFFTALAKLRGGVARSDDARGMYRLPRALFDRCVAKDKELKIHMRVHGLAYDSLDQAQGGAFAKRVIKSHLRRECTEARLERRPTFVDMLASFLGVDEVPEETAAKFTEFVKEADQAEDAKA